MHKFSYLDITEDSSRHNRDSERIAIEFSIELLKSAVRQGIKSREAVEALFYVHKLWSFLIEDLANPENALSVELKAGLISIGIWMIKEAEAIRVNKSSNLEGLIEISETVCAGLK